MRILYSGIIGLALCVAVFTFQVFAADEMKTTTTLVTSSDAAISSATNAAFTLYIGDNLAGVTNPLKSLTFTVSGIYTGGGTIALSIDSNSATTKTFTLPTVSSPTPFEFVYTDPSNIINPTSAGSYTYTLNVVPSGVTVYDFATHMAETHRYVPPSCPDGASTNEKMKTNQFLVANADTAVSSATTSPFSLYIGDNLAGITNPVKSVHFIASGLYTGGGTVSFMLGSDAATQKTFTLPTVSAPTYIELNYQDPTSTINPTSAGTYNYTLTTTPAGVTIHGLGIKLVETHRYKPPTCGGMPVSGELYSAVFDTTGTAIGPAYNAILWKGALGGPGLNEGKVRFQLAASDCANGATNYPTCNTGSWAFVGGDTCSSSDWFESTGADVPYDLQASGCGAAWNNKRYFRYGVQICSDDCTDAGSYTPTVEDVIVNWAP